MRETVYLKYDGHCAYCGSPITIKEMHVDHIIPKYRHSQIHDCLIVGGKKFTEYGVNDIRNLNPACGVCNRWKSTYSVEEFRHEIYMQVERLRKNSAPFRMAERYGTVKATNNPVVFYFEGIS